MRKRNYTKQVGLILTEENYNLLIEQTNKEEVTVSEWIRQAIEHKLVYKPLQNRTDNIQGRK
jgi:hypothetical protein